MTAEEIRARLNELAPFKPADNITAVSLARWLAMEAQVIWARMLDPGGPIDPRDIGAMHGYFAAAHALLAFHSVAMGPADHAAQQIAAAIDSAGDVGEWLWELHGANATEVGLLSHRLAALTEVDAAGHVQAREPA